MRILFSNKSKKENYKDKKRFKSYWRKIYPSKYVDLMTGATLVNPPQKLASKPKEYILKGKLKQTKDGFVYVDVPNSIIDGFYDMIKHIEKVQRPPYFNKKFNNIGAHISVFKSDEIEENELDIKEIGADVEYSLKDFYTVNPDKWDEMERVWFIGVESKDLERIRDRYGLSKKIEGHDFHITVGVRKA